MRFSSSGISSSLRVSSATTWLIAVNMVMFAVIWLAAIPADIIGLNSAAKGVLKHPWSPFTYMFAHYSFWHLLCNMLWLWLFGRVLERSLTGISILLIYLAGGMAGALFYIVAASLTSLTGTLCGASAAVLAIMTAAGFRAPNLMVRLWLIGDIKLKWIVAACVALLFIGIGGSGFWAHLGGLTAGTLSQSFSKTAHTGKKIKKNRYHQPSRRRVRKLTRQLAQRRIDMERLDKLLDKVRISGFESLSDSDKTELHKLSHSLSLKQPDKPLSH